MCALHDLRLEYQLDALKLKNFMGFENTGWIELKPITLLFGRNSAGKSAIIRAILLLKQSMEAWSTDTQLVFAGDLIDLGSYHNAVFRHDVGSDITFSFRITRSTQPSPPSQPQINASVQEIEKYKEAQKIYEQLITEFDRTQALWTKAERASVDDWKADLHLTYGLIETGEHPKLKSLSINGYRDDQELLVFAINYDGNERAWVNPRSDAILDYSVSIPLEENGVPLLDENGVQLRGTEFQKQFSHRMWDSVTLDIAKSIVPSLRTRAQADIKDRDLPNDWRTISDALEFFDKNISRFLSDIEYLPPLRDQAQRSYRLNENWVRQFAEQTEITIQVNAWLRSMSLNATIEPKEFSLTEGLIGIYLREDQLSANLRDTGAGVAQVLPVVATLLTARPGSTVIVEQPELHMHPEAQQTLAALFVACIKTGVRLLIETHSEHIFYHIRRLLTIPSDSNLGLECAGVNDFVLIFIDRVQGQSSAMSVFLNGDGTLNHPPLELRYFFGYNEEMRRQLDENYRLRLRNGLRARFTIEELTTLCVDLNLDAEDVLLGDGKTSMIDSLVLYCERLGLTNRLFRKCLDLRPNYEW